MTCAQMSTLGVYLLGALDPEDRSTFESHLVRCDICRSELVRLAPLPGLLNQITPADFEVTGEIPVIEAEPPAIVAEPSVPVPDLPPVPDDLPPVPDDLPAVPPVSEIPRAPQPRKRYWLVAAAAALVVVLAVGAIIGYQALREQPAPAVGNEVIWSATDPTTGVAADVRMIERSWGTELWVSMRGAPPDRECKLRVVARYGYHAHKDPYAEVAGWWATDEGPDREIPGSTSITLDAINELEFVDNYDNKLVEVHRPR